MLKRVFRKNGVTPSVSETALRRHQEEERGVGDVTKSVEAEVSENELKQNGAGLSRMSFEEDLEVAIGAEDSDGMRAARARLSLDDAKIRCRPIYGCRRAGDVDSIPLRAIDNTDFDIEGIVAINSKSHLPVNVGTCGEAGWEPFRGENRRSSVEIRKENQDAYVAMVPFFGAEDQMLFGVCDGHGAEGRKVSHLVRSTITKVLRDCNAESRPEVSRELSPEQNVEQRADVHRSRLAALHKAYFAAEEELKKPHRNIGHMYSGTTVVLAWLVGTDLYCSWTGDSRGVVAYASAQNGSWEKKFKAVDLSSDHKPSRTDEKKRVRAMGGRIARWRKNVGPLRVWVPTQWIPGLAMTRSVGDTLLSDFGVVPVPEVTYMKVGSSESFIVLASDGVWEFMSSQEVVDFVGKRRLEGVDPNLAAEALVREATKRWRRNEIIIDDTTAVVVYLNFVSDTPTVAMPKRGLFSFGKSKAGNRPVLVGTNGQISSFEAKNDG
eukprot:Plantae.Rhodophyta-Purpureofilum_apyrenoidigerum.ctg5008.p1 GENE.Plantae.Rhodophyta-Purpureofilum_apyrenoidigerum.ctg5008~~Plantae.Rhodophyta-Purpureofilum_apyrenoidigerum.ctg5008.p1  ORF type:complete len:493 (+),score=79.33 Plantae.Rhodophyta-Purpureofilum_apyrenoidigerum.ctg5008:115-1593(+)